MNGSTTYIWGVAEITEGTEERQAFAEHYRGYIEMTYLIANWRRF
jgi:hypothetical protein